MHDEVHAHEPEARRDAVGKGVPAVEHDCDVVEPVQKNHVFLLQHQKHGVEELRKLGHDEEGNPHADGAVQVPLARIAAHGREKAVAVQCAHEVRHRLRGPEHGKYGQDEIPCGKGDAQPKGGTVAKLLWEVEHDAKIKAHGKDRDFCMLLQVLDPRLASEVGFGAEQGHCKGHCGFVGGEGRGIYRAAVAILEECTMQLLAKSVQATLFVTTCIGNSNLHACRKYFYGQFLQYQNMKLWSSYLKTIVILCLSGSEVYFAPVNHRNLDVSISESG